MQAKTIQISTTVALAGFAIWLSLAKADAEPSAAATDQPYTLTAGQSGAGYNAKIEHFFSGGFGHWRIFDFSAVRPGPTSQRFAWSASAAAAASHGRPRPITTQRG